MNKNEENWRKLRAYLMQFTSYILKKANDDNAGLALGSLILASFYQALPLVLVPRCPEDFQAQVGVVTATLDKVLDYLHGANADSKTRDQLINEVATRFDDITQLTGRCAGIELKITDKPPGDAFTVAYHYCRGKYYQVGKKLPKAPVPPPSPSLIELAQKLAKSFERYHSQLLDYILQKAGKDRYTLLAIKALEVLLLYSYMAVALIFPCPWLFEGEAIERTTIEIKNMVSLLNKAYRPEDSAKDYEQIEVEQGLWAFAEMDYILWKRAFLMDMALCIGIDLDLELLPKGNAMELILVNYQPYTPQGSQEAPAS